MIFSKHNLPNGYYIYSYIRNRNSCIASEKTPYYIGKGIGCRAWRHDSRDISPPENENTRIVIIAHNLTENEAFILEKKLIAKFGRVNNGTGILRNRTDGGEGVSGYRHTEKAKEKLRIQRTGVPKSAEHRKNMLGNTTGMVLVKDKDGNKFKISKTDPRFLSKELVGIRAGEQVSSEGISNISKGLKGKTKGMVTVKDEDGNKFKVENNDPRYLSRELLHISVGLHYTHKERTCPHCGKIGRGPNMTRFHFNKCKKLISIDQK
jgi:hypothetical protein